MFNIDFNRHSTMLSNTCKRKSKMNDKSKETNEELNCHVTVNDGSYMTCDMIEEESSEEKDVPEGYDI